MASISQNDACPSFVYELAPDEHIQFSSKYLM